MMDNPGIFFAAEAMMEDRLGKGIIEVAQLAMALTKEVGG